MAEKNKIKALIFDMDGTLTDTYDIIWSSLNAVLKPYGHQLSQEFIVQYSGRSLTDQVLGWNKEFGLNLDIKDVVKVNWALQQKRLHELKPSPGLLALLNEAISNEMLLAVGTSSQKFRTEAILNTVFPEKYYFSHVVSSNDVKRHKPHPDIFLEAARRLNVKPENCLVFEDASNGIEAARNAGMKVIGFKNPHNSYGELAKADFVITDYGQLTYDKIQEI